MIIRISFRHTVYHPGPIVLPAISMFFRSEIFLNKIYFKFISYFIFIPQGYRYVNLLLLFSVFFYIFNIINIVVVLHKFKSIMFVYLLVFLVQFNLCLFNFFTERFLPVYCK